MCERYERQGSDGEHCGTMAVEKILFIVIDTLSVFQLHMIDHP